jgi:purine catabolism regulator
VSQGFEAEQRRQLEQVLETHRRFARIVADGGGTNEIASTLHDLIGCPVAVVDPEGVPIVVIPSDISADRDIVRASTTRQPISGTELTYGEVLAMPDAAPLDGDGLVALESAAVAIAGRLATLRAVGESDERFAAITLEELVSGHGDPANVAERALALGWDLTRPRAVLLASIDEFEEGTIPPSALNTIAAAARATLGADAIVWARTATIAALLSLETAQPAERRELADVLRRELDVRLRSVTVSIGVGRRVDTFTELPRSFVEASHAVDVGRWAKGRHVTEVYDELGLERLLAATPSDDLADFVQRAIGALADYDAANATELLDTLGAWLDTRNMAEASRQMHVHYNTFKNRLERIESILGPILTDSAHALECEVALYVYRHYDLS